MREDFKARLLEIAIRIALQKGTTLTSTANVDLIIFINQGVDKMTTSEYNSDASRKLAEENLIRLINAMNLDSKSRNINESLDYISLSNSAKSICPLWPFC